MSAGSLARQTPVVRPWRRRPAAARATLTVAGLTVLAGVLRFYGLGHQGYWYDEATTALLMHFPPGRMLGLIPQSESTPPLYYCVAWVWTRLLGNAEAGLRSLSALAGNRRHPGRLRGGHPARLAPRGSDLRRAGRV